MGFHVQAHRNEMLHDIGKQVKHCLIHTLSSYSMMGTATVASGVGGDPQAFTTIMHRNLACFYTGDVP